MQPSSNTTTSRDAAAYVEPLTESLEGQVLRTIRNRAAHGATDQEIAERLQMDQNTQRPRRRSLVQKGLVADSGKRRKTASGRDAIVWVSMAYAPKGTVKPAVPMNFVDRVREALGAKPNATQNELIEQITALVTTAKSLSEPTSVIDINKLAEIDFEAGSDLMGTAPSISDPFRAASDMFEPDQAINSVPSETPVADAVAQKGRTRLTLPKNLDGSKSGRNHGSWFRKTGPGMGDW